MTTTKALLVPADTTQPVQRIELDGYYRTVQQHVGGPFDFVRADTFGGYVHDEGLLLEQPQNLLCTYLFRQVIVGDVVIVGVLNAAGHYDGDNHDVPEWLTNMIFGEDEE